MAKRQMMNRDITRWLAMAALAAAAALQACAPAEGDADTAAADSADAAGARITNVEVTAVRRGPFVDYIRVTGEVEAMNDVTVSAEESGRLEGFLVEKGRSVQAGQPIARLDDDLLLAQVEESRAAAELATEQYARQRQLWEEERIGTELAYLRSRYEAEMAAARLSQLEARLAHTVIVAPVSGVFDEKFLEEGEMASPGAPVARIVSTARVKVAAGVPERLAASVEVGDSARVWFDVFQGRDFSGRIGFVGSSVDVANRTFPIEIVLHNPNRLIKPHMVANVQVARERLDDVITAPQQVVLRSADGYKVFVVVERNGRPVAVARTVTLGPSSGNHVVIESGLEVGDRLVTLGHQLVDDGSRVRIVNAPSAPAEPEGAEDADGTEGQ
jgi:RND family efflux transporter MFP subunit